MIVDADDLLSCNIAKFVTQYPECYGWCIDKGYEYREGTKYIYYMKSKFYDKCGSCNIIRFDLLDKYINADVADITNSDIADIGGFNFLHHQSIPPLMIKNGTPLEKLPFEGAVYVIDHGENMWLGAITSNMLKQANFKDLFLFKLRRFVKKMLSQRLSDSIRQTFSLYTLS
ncbi:MAG: hypothetical protein NW214_15210 [Pseudanabaenaceae cyanobacterium bins.39]|nr:hypothetical protein [Pseudanabaenaceae cyanobacterium bins.39]